MTAADTPLTLDTAVAQAKDIADRVLAASAAANDKAGRFSEDAVDALGEAGLLGLTIPVEHGGSGLGPRAFAAVVAALASGRLGCNGLQNARLRRRDHLGEADGAKFSMRRRLKVERASFQEPATRDGIRDRSGVAGELRGLGLVAPERPGARGSWRRALPFKRRKRVRDERPSKERQ